MVAVRGPVAALRAAATAARRGGGPSRPPAELRALPGHAARVRRAAARSWRPPGSTAAGVNVAVVDSGVVGAAPRPGRPRGRELRGGGRWRRHVGAGVSAAGQHVRHRRERARHARGGHRGRATERRRTAFTAGSLPGAGVVGLLGGRGPDDPLRGGGVRPHPRPPRARGGGGELLLRGLGRRALRLGRSDQPGNQGTARRRDRGRVLQWQLRHEHRGRRPAGRVGLLADRARGQLQDQPLLGRAVGDERRRRAQGSRRASRPSSTSRSTPRAATPIRRPP